MVEASTEKKEGLKLCKNNRCCGKYLFYAEKEEGKRELVPLKKVDIKAELSGAMATIDMELTYTNPSADNPLECTYVFPLEKTTILSKFEAVIGGKTVHTKVTEKEAAKEAYDDAIAGGKAAVMAERSSKKEETMTVKLGNLLPGQDATLKATIVSTLEIFAGHYAFYLPVAFYPDYKKHGQAASDAFIYDFNYTVTILSASGVSDLSLPSNSAVTEKDEKKTKVTISCKQPSRTIDLYYRTGDMLIPQVVYARSPNDSNYVGCAVSLVPTFDPIRPQDFYAEVCDEKPSQEQLSDGSSFHFLFIVDRSGSMRNKGRMKLAKEALDIFIRSLPKGCKFSIISFGTLFDSLMPSVMDYDDESKQRTLDQIKDFGSNYGSTNILSPLKAAQEIYNSEDTAAPGDIKKRIFLLTDGSVGSPDQVIEQAKLYNDTCRVFSFGLGSGCDKNLVNKVAQSGRGTSTIVQDGCPNLKGLVIKALTNAMEPSLKGAQWSWNSAAMCESEELYRNSLVSSTCLMSASKLDEVTFQFKAESTDGEKNIDLTFTKADFVEVEGPAAEALFKTTVYNELEKFDSDKKAEKIQMSVKYQVLVEETAIIGVMKQADKVTGELTESKIDFGKDTLENHDAQNSHQVMRKKGRKMKCKKAEYSRLMAQMASQQPMSRPAPMSNLALNFLFASPKQESKEVLEETKQSSANLFQEVVEKEHKKEADPKPVIVGAALSGPKGTNKSDHLEPEKPSRPSLVTVLQGQTSDGNWTVESRFILANCVQNGDIEDAGVRQALAEMQLTESATAETVYLSLLAIYILEERFPNDEDEWVLIVRKACTYLKQAGVEKPNQIARQFTLTVLEE